MKYEEAIKLWAAKKLGIDPASVESVWFDIDQGYQCCGGSDPDCYCSFAESPSLEANIATSKGTQVLGYLDMGQVLREVFEVSE